MNKVELMKEFMNTFTGNGFHLVIREKGESFLVHTIGIVQKVDDQCPVTDIPIGEHFLLLLANDENNREASIFSNWSEQLLRNLLDQHNHAKQAGYDKITMFKENPSADNDWFLAWGGKSTEARSEALSRAQPVAYIC